MIAAASTPFRVVVPSRGRAHNMPRLMKLLPFAEVVIDHREEKDYAPHVPQDRLVLRETIEACTCAKSLNWILDNFKDESVVMIDDDLRFVRCLVGMQRKLTKPADIYQVIENGYYGCRDLELGMYCWTRSANSFLLNPEFKPFRAVAPVCAAYGVMGPARDRRFETSLRGREDIDYTLWELLENRIVYCDARFYFDFGKCFSGKGGNVGQITSKDFDWTTQDLKRRWGRYISVAKGGFMKKAQQSPLSIKVRRSSPLVKQLD